MSRNESNLDRMIRVAVGLSAGFGAVAVGASSVLGIVMFVVAGILLVTAAAGFCPLYRLLGISTDKTAPKISTHV